MKKMAAVLDVGTSKVALALGCREASGGVEVLGVGICAYPGFKDGLWLDAQALPMAVSSVRADAEAMAHRKIREVYVSIPGEFSRLVFRDARVEIRGKGGRVSREDMHRAIVEASDFPIPKAYQPLYRVPVVYTVDDVPVHGDPCGAEGHELGIYVALLLGDTGYMDNMESQLEALGLQVVDFLPAPSALGAWAAYTQQTAHGSTVIIDSGHYTSDVIIVEGGNAVFHQSIPCGGYHFTSDLSHVLDISLAEAERVKRKCMVGMKVPMGDDVALEADEGVIRVDMDLAQQVIEARMEDIVRRVIAAMAEFGVKPGKNMTVLLAGDGMQAITGAREYISHLMGVTVKDFVPQTALLKETGQLTCEALLWQELGSETTEEKENPIRSLIQRLKERF